MLAEKKILKNLSPTENPRLIDLVDLAGLDISDWANFKGGASKAATNPKYCYEWCFKNDKHTVLNVWFDTIEVEERNILVRLNMRARAKIESGVRSSRSIRMDDAIRDAFLEKKAVSVIILKDGSNTGKRKVVGKRLDEERWHVPEYDEKTGEAILVRGLAQGISPIESFIDPEALQFPEGKARTSFYTHRQREQKLRAKKIAHHKLKHGGNLPCEVDGCGFDFKKTYGNLGTDYAQVHHLIPLASAPPEGMHISLDDLAVVCANCHVMIRRGGECRELSEVSGMLSSGYSP